MPARWQPSPNFGERRGGARADMVVLHYTAMKGARAAVDWLCDPASQVSAHYLIAASGEVVAMVDEDMRAWHAGAAAWGGVGDVNSRSIGIELDNDGFSPFAAAQMLALEALLDDILTRRSIPPERVLAHSDVAPARKIDPGRRFDWRRLALAGLSVWPEAGAGGNDFAVDAERFGYDPQNTQAVLEAFRRRFRPWARGPLDATDAALIADLDRRFPVDRSGATA